MKTLKIGATALLMVGATLALGACADGYSSDYSSVSVGVSSSGGYPTYRDRDRDGIPNRYDRDRDGDGVPNRYDIAPSNPYRD